MADPYAQTDASSSSSSTSSSHVIKHEGGGEVEHKERRPWRFGNKPQIGLETVVLTEKLILPVKQFPTYNFVGKLLGPKGSNLKGMQALAQVRMAIKGKGSTRESGKEGELLASGEPQHEHLAEPLHVLITVRASRIEAHRRLAIAFKELNKFMGPVNEEISFGQNNATLEMQPPLMLPTTAAPVAPKIMFGIPPPGAIILNDNPAFVTQPPLPRNNDQHRTQHRRQTYSAYGRPSANRAEKRGAPTPGAYAVKRVKKDPYSSYL